MVVILSIAAGHLKVLGKGSKSMIKARGTGKSSKKAKQRIEI